MRGIHVTLTRLIAAVIVISLAACRGATAVPPVPVAGTPTLVAVKRGAAVQILVTNYDKPSVGAIEFAVGARGNAVPLRRFAVTAQAFGIRSDGSYWTGPYYGDTGPYDPGWVERHDAQGAVILKIAGPTDEPIREATTSQNGGLILSSGQQYEYGGYCSLIEGHLKLYSPARSFRPVRSIDTVGACNSVVSADGKGNIFLGYDDDGYNYAEDGASIDEVGPSATDIRSPTRSIGFGFPYTTIQGLETDTRGDLFALVNNQLFEYAPGKTNARYVLKGVPVSSFTIDSKNDLYVIVGAYIEEFAPGAQRPMRVIGGPATGLTEPLRISVAD